MDLAGRLRRLIDRDFAGNVNRAAKSWGVPQPTLFRYANGRTQAPKAGTLRKIAAFYSTTVEWLLDGVGSGPLEPEYPIVEFRAWDTLVKALNLPESVEQLVVGLPGSIGSANFVLCRWGLPHDTTKWVSKTRARPARQALYLAAARELEAWTIWLRGLVTSYGRLAVRNKLMSELDRVRLGLQPFAMYVHGTGGLPKDLGLIYDEFLPAGQPRGTTLFDSPAVPPLNAARGRQPLDVPLAGASVLPESADPA